MAANSMTSKQQYVGFWSRTWASVIDMVLMGLIIYPVLIATYGWSYFGSGKFIAGPVDFLVAYVLPAIAVILFWMYKLATPGKMAVSARIVDARTGNRPSNAQFIGRYFAYLVSIIPVGLGLLWVVFDGRKQGWHDKLAGTVVVRPQADRSLNAQFDSSDGGRGSFAAA